MSLILQIETATTSCSVALAQNGRTLALEQLNERNIHAEVITLFIEKVFQQAGKKLNDVDAIAVSAGPGSYTGLRIGVSTAKGLCFALDKPLIAIETLAAMSAGFLSRSKGMIPENALLCPMIDARRMEVFTAVFNQQGEKRMDTAAVIIDESSFYSYLQNQPVIFFGDGADKCQSIYQGKKNAIIIPDFSNSAEDINNLALSHFEQGNFVDVAYYEPFYLKEFIAGKPNKN
jgi:tRNA threonylcarbamoyladenosine biosynthesis protein TsaB